MRNSHLIDDVMNPFSQFIDLIYPPRCSICRTFLNHHRARIDQRALRLCPTCFEGFTRISSPMCLICGKPFASGREDHTCEDCLRKRPHYDRTRAPYLYRGGLMTAIHQYKYGRKSHLAETLGPLLVPFSRTWLSHLNVPLVMPIPLHPGRLRERGFNQSLLLAKFAVKALDAELDFLVLRRVKYTRPQTGLKIDERRKNVRRAFGVVDGKAVKGRNVILVDDVATTGNTLNECARVLKRAGAGKVFGLVLARTGDNPNIATTGAIQPF